jgi:hypothetical protein
MFFKNEKNNHYSFQAQTKPSNSVKRVLQEALIFRIGDILVAVKNIFFTVNNILVTVCSIVF